MINEIKAIIDNEQIRIGKNDNGKIVICIGRNIAEKTSIFINNSGVPGIMSYVSIDLEKEIKKQHEDAYEAARRGF